MTDFETEIIEWLDSVEAMPKMYATTVEALEATYLTLLTCLLLHQGKDGGDVVRSVYWKVTSYGQQGCSIIPIWARQDVSLTQAVDYLKQVRKEVMERVEEPKP